MPKKRNVPRETTRNGKTYRLGPMDQEATKAHPTLGHCAGCAFAFDEEACAVAGSGCVFSDGVWKEVPSETPA